jgi:hypothetical protein
LPVQNIVVDAWWAASSQTGGKAKAQTAVIPVHSSIYVLPNGDRRAIERHGSPLDQHGRLTVSPNREKPFNDVTTTLDPARGPNFPQTLPDDPDQLRALLAPKDGCSTNPGGCLLKQVSELYNNYVIDPALASRLWHVLRTEPTITTLGAGRDRLGRPAVALTSPSSTPTEQFIVLADPKTGAFLGSETILIGRDSGYDLRPPAVIQFTALAGSRRLAETDVPSSRTTVRY